MIELADRAILTLRNITDTLEECRDHHMSLHYPFASPMKSKLIFDLAPLSSGNRTILSSSGDSLLERVDAHRSTSPIHRLMDCNWQEVSDLSPDLACKDLCCADDLHPLSHSSPKTTHLELTRYDSEFRAYSLMGLFCQGVEIKYEYSRPAREPLAEIWQSPNIAGKITRRRRRRRTVLVPFLTSVLQKDPRVEMSCKYRRPARKRYVVRNITCRRVRSLAVRKDLFCDPRVERYRVKLTTN
ncbi:uncharacterized protein EDB91DRAFT_875247 [Suillus paluster]|uniref:uncharacterized protein n=1 Tax=Suillus paluster TaxID=48578 RepID=UPI001B886DDC|nr:uncharacterized protein EDB91DRAFT_875247 [Suillus paluster]KAG1748338.1 hypothetical protein EDB91DRAFT_875247 [Suillus paluster]